MERQSTGDSVMGERKGAQRGGDRWAEKLRERDQRKGEERNGDIKERPLCSKLIYFSNVIF